MVFIISRSTRRKVFLCLGLHSHARASMTSRLSGLSKLIKCKMNPCSLLSWMMSQKSNNKYLGSWCCKYIYRVFQLSEIGFRVSMWEKMMSVRIYWIDIFFIRAENSCWWNVSMVRRQLTTLQCSPQKGKEPSKFSWRTPCCSLAGERGMHFPHIIINFLNEQYFTESRTLNRLPQLSTP